MLNKPINYVCSRKQQGKTPTIYSLLPDKFHNLKPVGRIGTVALSVFGDIVSAGDGEEALAMA